ncbi:MAG: hypothetical protein ACK514_07080 [Bacteroidota bacterium]|jgi:hypothetical protein|nr:outer membrane beta-barrel protein [Cytophagales bacterium]MCE2958402.1 outer membrane beta-barrel protein [Flammeovirgaceae bacterium]MCZ8071675.1 outer membrane beta-barrel protein [Cytophagales bacterium]
MKPIPLIFLAVISLNTFAQEVKEEQQTEQGYKARAKNITAEVNFNPFSNAPISINYLRLRTFVNNQQAFRIGFSVSAKNQKQIEDVTQSSFEISLRPGYEWHFAGTDRLSPYVGFDADITFKSSSYSDDRPAGTRGNTKSISGAWDVNGNERGFTRFGANFLIGADYYVVKRLYLGLEIGYGFQVVNSSDISVTLYSGTAPAPAKGGSTFQLGPNFNSALRLGFVF